MRHENRSLGVPRRPLVALSVACIVLATRVSAAQPMPAEPEAPPAVQPGPPPGEPDIADPPAADPMPPTGEPTPPPDPMPPATPDTSQPLGPAVVVVSKPPEDGAGSAGYARGFYIRSADGTFGLRLGLFSRIRYTYLDLDAVGARSFETAFAINRLRLRLSGHLLTEQLRYGVQVARLAGMPDRIVRQARSTLEALEAQSRAGQAQVDLFAAPPEPQAATLSALEQAVAAIEPDTLTPREALDALYRLKALLKDNAP